MTAFLKWVDSRQSSIIGFALAVVAALATHQGNVLLSDFHISNEIIKIINDLQALLLVAGVGLMARGKAALGGDQEKNNVIK